MPAQRYNPDHTAHIRHRLATQASFAAGGLVIAVAMAGVIWLTGSLAGGVPTALQRLVWVLDAVLAGVSLLTLAVTGVEWLVHQRRRADLDAHGAQIVGEFTARRALGRRRDEQ